MARLTPEQWLAAKADFEIAGLSVTEIADKYRLDKAAVSRRAKKEAWQAGKSQPLSTRKVNAIIELAECEAQSQQAKLNSVERAVFDRVVADDVAFRLQNDADMEAVREHAMSLLPLVEKPTDAKALMETLRIQREARLGKAPDTAIQINNGEVASGIDRLHARRIGGRDA